MKRTIPETIEYFERLSYEFKKEAHRYNDLIADGKSEAYELAAFQLKHNLIDKKEC